ncbi:MAG: sugar phosphate isomerase/epimerase, partial [Candidatus Bathyarchaeota archaeon]|nr:sugar phosphate isomerase/epimerase [Candidatus Bathyarchaeota archaeon]
RYERFKLVFRALLKLACCMQALRENLEVLSKLGFQGIEVPGSLQLNPYTVSKEDRRRLKELVESYGLKIVASNVIYPRGFQHTSSDEYTRMRSIEYTWRLAEAAAEIDCRILVWGSSHARNIPPDIVLDIARERNLAVLREASRAGEEYGVVFAIEPLSKRESNFINTVLEAYEIAESIGSDHLMVLADIRHMIREEDSVLDSLKAVAKRLIHMHIADENMRVPGRGVVDFSKVFRTLDEIGYRGYLSIEARIGEKPFEELSFAKSYIEDSYRRSLLLQP